MRPLTTMILTAALTLPALPAGAALSGYWDSAKILHMILGDSRLADALKQQPVERIERNEHGYLIASRNCTVQVGVRSTLPDRPGPTRHSVSIGKGRCD